MTDEQAIITCEKCGAQNPPEARFCGYCGNLLISELDREQGPVSTIGGAWPAEGDEGSRYAALDPLDPDPEPEPETAPASAAGPEHEPQAMAEPASAPLNPDLPGAGLAPGTAIPPPPGQPQSPQAPRAAEPPEMDQPHLPGGSVGLKSPPLQAQPPAGSYQSQGSYSDQYQVPPPGYGYSLPGDGNTSGMGEGYAVPEVAKGWHFGGFVPFGLFSFINGSPLWGAIGLIGYLLGFYWIYSIIVGFTGKEQAWRNRRFDSTQQYIETMGAWNTWGLVLLLLSVAVVVLYLIFVFAIVGTALTQGY